MANFWNKNNSLNQRSRFGIFYARSRLDFFKNAWFQFKVRYTRLEVDRSFPILAKQNFRGINGAKDFLCMELEGPFNISLIEDMHMHNVTYLNQIYSNFPKVQWEK